MFVHTILDGETFELCDNGENFFGGVRALRLKSSIVGHAGWVRLAGQEGAVWYLTDTREVPEGHLRGSV